MNTVIHQLDINKLAYFSLKSQLIRRLGLLARLFRSDLGAGCKSFSLEADARTLTNTYRKSQDAAVVVVR